MSGELSRRRRASAMKAGTRRRGGNLISRRSGRGGGGGGGRWSWPSLKSESLDSVFVFDRRAYRHVQADDLYFVWVFV